MTSAAATLHQRSQGEIVLCVEAAGPSATLTITTQAAERVYRTLGPAATVDIKLKADTGSTLLWLPQETILFDGASLTRTFELDLRAGATFLAVESAIFGRAAMGEAVKSVALHDRWRRSENRRGARRAGFRWWRQRVEWQDRCKASGERRLRTAQNSNSSAARSVGWE